MSPPNFETQQCIHAPASGIYLFWNMEICSYVCVLLKIFVCVEYSIAQSLILVVEIGYY